MSLVRSAAALVAAALLILSTLGAGNADELDPAAQQQRILDGQLKALSDVMSPDLQQALAAAQAVWAANRDQTCAFQGKFAASYSATSSGAYPSAAAQCLARMNEQRLQELQGYLSRLMKYQQMVAARTPSAVENVTPPQDASDSRVLREGLYLVTGRNPSGGSYSGTCRITAMGDNRYRFEWKVGPGYVGSGVLRGDTISVEWGSDSPAIYKIQPDGSLSGTWANGRGTEFLRPAS